MKATRATPAAFLWSESLRRGGYGHHHPLATPRVPLTHDLIHACNAFACGELVEAHPAAAAELCAFHAPDYIEAYVRAERLGRVDPQARDRYRLGTLENPYFPGFFTIPATAAGASIRAAELLLEGRVAFNPAGGMHHARRARAQGFCFLNDAVLAVLRLRRAGLRVLYIDIDAHHCDAVEAAFGDEPEVFTLSLHMDTSYAYPFAGGRFEDQGDAGSGRTQLNLPLPAGVHDAEYLYLFDTVLERVVGRYRPQAVVLQAGADALMHDPLARLRLTAQGFAAVVQSVVDASPRGADGSRRLMAVGGGGYHPAGHRTRLAGRVGRSQQPRTGRGPARAGRPAAAQGRLGTRRGRCGLRAALLQPLRCAAASTDPRRDSRPRRSRTEPPFLPRVVMAENARPISGQTPRWPGIFAKFIC